MNKPVVIATTPSFGKFSNKPWELAEELGLDLRRSSPLGPLTAEQLAEAAVEADAIIVGVDQVTELALKQLPKLKVIGKHGVGVDNIDLEAAKRLGIRVASTPGANASAVAELAVTLLLAGAKQLNKMIKSLESGNWETFAGVGLEGKTLGLLGFGNIGKLVAKRMQSFELKVLFYDPYLSDSEINGAKKVELDELLALSDFVSLHLPHTSGSAPLITGEKLKLMKATAGIINTARGGLIDDTALAEALNQDRLGFAALDAFQLEPLPLDSVLRTAKNTILTPHAAAFTDIANERMGVQVVQAVAQLLSGEEAASAIV